MKRDTLRLPGGMSVETSKDWNGRFFIAYGKQASVFVRCPKELRKFLKLSLGTASRAALDSWLESLQNTEAEASETAA